MSGSFARLTQTKPVDMSTAASSPKKASKPKAAPKAPAAHPPTTAMITAAVEALKDRTGSSVPAIKKYIAANYKFDVEKKAHFIKRALKALVEKGTLLQVKGTGASGSFKINVAAKKAEEKAAKKAAKKPAKKPAAKKATKPKTTKPKKPKAKKAATPKKTKKPEQRMFSSSQAPKRTMFPEPNTTTTSHVLRAGDLFYPGCQLFSQSRAGVLGLVMGGLGGNVTVQRKVEPRMTLTRVREEGSEERQHDREGKDDDEVGEPRENRLG
ncbi:histone H3-K27 trimethylation [Branchiostoma belcheri]|nr:histone H3-K27 trimethylation [Branchiostoma belcheri]